MGWYRVLLVTVVASVVLAWSGPAHAQDEIQPTPDPAAAPAVTVLDSAEDAQPATGIVRDDDSTETVRRIRRDLIIVALATSVGLGVYVWHTSPTRRVRIAARRAESVLADDD